MTDTLTGRQAAVALGQARYYGASCGSHPELRGLRYTASANCIQCAHDSTQQQRDQRRKKRKQRSAQEAK